MTGCILEIKDLNVRYDLVDALSAVNISVQEGEVVVVVGSNGAGKTSLMKSVSGLLKPVGGTINFRGERIDGRSVHTVVERGISLIPEGRLVFGDQTVTENLLLGAYSRRRIMSRNEIEGQLENCFGRFPVLRQRSNQLAGTLSGGEQQMLAISRGLMSTPALLLIDEPSLGLAPKMIEDVFNIVRELNDEGLPILLVEQMAAIALKVANRGYVLENGRILLEGTAKELVENKYIVESYLGKKRG